MSTKQSSDLSAWLRDTIGDFINQSPENNLKDKDNEKAFEDCLVGYSRGDDPLYEAYKEYVGPFHWKPSEIFNLAFPDLDVMPEELTVISWILPHKEATKVDNRREKTYPAERWARARIFGEAFNTMLRKHVVEVLLKAGYESVAPLLSPEWSVKPSEPYVMDSTWSERHAAHASGLGTFGLEAGVNQSRVLSARIFTCQSLQIVIDRLDPELILRSRSWRFGFYRRSWKAVWPFRGRARRPARRFFRSAVSL